jgi:tetratricopeptide (TPR) repeat protein
MRQDARLGYLLKYIFIELKQNREELSQETLPLYDLQARSLFNLGKNKKAVALLEQVIKIKGTTLGPDHPDRLASQHALASAYQANGQVKEAVVLLEQVVKIKGTTLAPDYPDRLASQHALAYAYWVNGQVKEAVAMLEQVVKIKQSKLCEGHPSRVVSEEALAYFLQDRQL